LEQTPEIQPEQAIPQKSGKSRPKWKQELYTWLLAFLSAALFLTIYIKTSNGWLATLGFLTPSLFIVLSYVIFDRKKNSRHRPEAAATFKRDSTLSNTVLRIEYFDGRSPIGVDGMGTGPSEDKSLPDPIPWLQIMQAKVLSLHEIELMISENPPGNTLQLQLKLDEQLVAKDTVSAVNAIVLAHKMLMRMRMGKFDILVKYIPMIQVDSIAEWVYDKENDGTPEHPIHMPFVAYSEMVHNFIYDVHTFEKNNKDMELARYRDILKDNGLEWATESMKNADVSNLNAQCVLALIIGAVRAEHSCVGALLDFFKSGCILKWLERLKSME